MSDSIDDDEDFMCDDDVDYDLVTLIFFPVSVSRPNHESYWH